jgi:hypothetical protein
MSKKKYNDILDVAIINQREIEWLNKALGELMVQANGLYTELACDADLMRQLPETHPVKEAMRSFERTYLGRTEG